MQLSVGEQAGDMNVLSARRIGIPILCLDVSLARGSRKAFSLFVEAEGSVHLQVRDLGEDAIRLIDAFGRGNRAVTYSRERRAWQQLSYALLPPALTDHFISQSAPCPLLVVLGDPLWALPIAALPLDRYLLVHKAVIAQLPSIRLAEVLAKRVKRGGYGCVADIDETLPGASAEFHALEVHLPPVRPLDLAGATSGKLDARENRLLAISGHGNVDRGLAQGVVLSNGRVWRAAHALTEHLPATLVLGACWANRPSTTPGDEPLGLATVALLRGADVVIGGIFGVNSYATGEVLAATHRFQADGYPATQALQMAQSVMALKGQPLADWAGLIAIGLPCVAPKKANLELLNELPQDSAGVI
jgi:CHAT domain-containing protein